MMTVRLRVFGTALALMLASGSIAYAQQQGGKSDMPGMSGHDMQGMDMQSTMKQCAQMRQQMKPGAKMSPEMKKMKSDCYVMDRYMNTATQHYTSPARRQ